jgi:hypothetical protein
VDASNSGPLIITVKLATARVSGRVIGAANLDQFRQIQQVPSVELRISSYPAGSAKFTAPIGADGVFEFPKVPQGKYTATVIPNTPGSIPITIDVGDTHIGGIVLMVPNVTPTR